MAKGTWNRAMVFERTSDSESGEPGRLQMMHQLSPGDRFAGCCSRVQSLDLGVEFTKNIFTT